MPTTPKEIPMTHQPFIRSHGYDPRGVDGDVRWNHRAPWPEDLGEGERIRLSGPGGSEEGVTIRVSSGDRFTYRAADGVEREVHADDGVRVARLTEGG